VSRRVSRREALAMLGGAVVLGACGRDGKPAAAPSASGSAAPVTSASFASAAACRLTPEQTEGPYYIDVDAIRGDVREDREGTRLRIAARVFDTDGCTPVKDAVFEIWHCDANGLYSGFERSQGGPGGGVSDARRYLRGAQVTDDDGIATITTIYPGWYRGRTVHVHAKVGLTNDSVLTTQLYFDEKVTAAVHAAAPYSAHTGRDTFNANDGIYRAETTLTVSRDVDGYLGLVTIGVA
jgi:protocatechuate 3,4-dioxygenase beta subunit